MTYIILCVWFVTMLRSYSPVTGLAQPGHPTERQEILIIPPSQTITFFIILPSCSWFTAQRRLCWQKVIFKGIFINLRIYRSLVGIPIRHNLSSVARLSFLLSVALFSYEWNHNFKLLKKFQGLPWIIEFVRRAQISDFKVYLHLYDNSYVFMNRFLWRVCLAISYWLVTHYLHDVFFEERRGGLVFINKQTRDTK